MAETVPASLARKIGAPAYVASETLGSAPRVATRPVEVPRLPAPTIGQGVALLGNAAAEFIERSAKARAATQSLQARTGFMLGINKLVQQYRADPDPATAADRFSADVQQLQTEQLGNIALAEPRAEAELHMTAMALQAQRQMQNISLSRQQQDAVGGLKTRRGLYLQNAGAAGSPLERQATVDSFDADVDTATAGGFIAAPGAQAAKTRFRSDLAAGDAQTAIAHDPDRAAIALGDADSYPGLDPFSRAHLLEVANDAADGAAARAQRNADLAATRALGAGTLSRADLEAAAPAMSASAYRSIAAALTPPPPAVAAKTFDPQLYGSLLSRAAGGDASNDLLVDAADAYAAGRLDHAGFANVVRTNDQFAQDVDDAPWRIDQRMALYKLLAPSPGQSPAAARAQLDAAANFDSWSEQNPKATADQSQAQMETIAGQARAAAAASDRATLPLPAGITAPRSEIDGDALGGAAARVNDAFAAGALDRGTLVQQTNLLAAWQNAVGGKAAQ